MHKAAVCLSWAACCMAIYPGACVCVLGVSSVDNSAVEYIGASAIWGRIRRNGTASIVFPVIMKNVQMKRLPGWPVCYHHAGASKPLHMTAGMQMARSIIHSAASSQQSSNQQNKRVTCINCVLPATGTTGKRLGACMVCMSLQEHACWPCFRINSI